MNNHIKTYIDKKKIKKHFIYEHYEHKLIKKALDTHSFVFKDCDVIPICSTDIFSEALSVNGESYVLFDVNYVLYMQHIYKNILFLNYFIENDLHDKKEQIINNIKSDSYHFLSLINYRNTKLSLYFAEKARKLFAPVHIYNEINNDILLFYQIINIYIIRHENAHNNYKNPELSETKKSLKNNLKMIISLKEEETPTEDIVLRDLCAKNTRKLDNSLLISEINKMLDDTENNILFEEIFCDYLSFIECFIIYNKSQEKSIETLTKEKLIETLTKLPELLEIFDYLSDYFRRLSIEDQLEPNVNPRHLVRHYINSHIRQILIFDLLRKNLEDKDLMEVTLHYSQKVIMSNIFQNIYIEYLLKITYEAQVEKQMARKLFVNNVNHLSDEMAKELRDNILNWKSI